MGKIFQLQDKLNEKKTGDETKSNSDVKIVMPDNAPAPINVTSQVHRLIYGDHVAKPEIKVSPEPEVTATEKVALTKPISTQAQVFHQQQHVQKAVKPFAIHLEGENHASFFGKKVHLPETLTGTVIHSVGGTLLLIVGLALIIYSLNVLL